MCNCFDYIEELLHLDNISLILSFNVFFSKEFKAIEYPLVTIGINLFFLILERLWLLDLRLLITFEKEYYFNNFAFANSTAFINP